MRLTKNAAWVYVRDMLLALTTIPPQEESFGGQSGGRTQVPVRISSLPHTAVLNMALCCHRYCCFCHVVAQHQSVAPSGCCVTHGASVLPTELVRLTR